MMDRDSHPLSSGMTEAGYDAVPLHLQDIILLQRLIRPVLALQQDRAGFQGLEVVPLAGGDVQEAAAGDHVDDCGLLPRIVVEVLLEMPAHAHDRLGTVLMPMDGQHRPGLDRVQHPLGLVLRRVPEVVVHPKALGLLRRLGQLVQGLLADPSRILGR